MSFPIFLLLALLLLESGRRFAKCDDHSEEDYEDSEDDLTEYEDYYDADSDVWIREVRIGERYNVLAVLEGQAVAMNCTAISTRRDRLWSFIVTWEYRHDDDKILSEEYDELQQINISSQPTYTVESYSHEFEGLYAVVHTLLIDAAKPSHGGYYICTLSPNDTGSAHAEYKTAHLWYEVKVNVADSTTSAPSTISALNGWVTVTAEHAKTNVPQTSSDSHSLNAVDDNQAHSLAHSSLTPYEAAVMDCCISRGLYESPCMNACGSDVRTMVQFDWTRDCRWTEARNALQCYLKAWSHMQPNLSTRVDSETSAFTTRECCVQKRVSANCMHVCAGYNVFADDEACLPEFGRILECAFSSFDSLAIPDPPRFVRVMRVSPTRVKVKWLPPERSDKKVVGYEVYYACESDADLRSKATLQIEYQRLSTRALSATLEINEKGVLSVFVQSFNAHGFSTPSAEVRLNSAQSLFDVLRVVRLTNFDHTGALQQAAKRRIFECCAQRVSTECAQLFCSSNASVSASDAHDVDAQEAQVIDHCLFGLPDVLACFANDRDVTQCCVHEQIASACIPYCGDQLENGVASRGNNQSIFAHETCIFELPKMRDCFVRGWLDTPSPPRALQFVRLTCSNDNSTCSVELKWYTPLENAQHTMWYAVNVYTTDTSTSVGGRELTAKLPAVRVDRATHSVTIGGLYVGEKYDFSVIAVSSFGQSAASNHVRILTACATSAARRGSDNAALREQGHLSARVDSRTSDSIQISWNDVGEQQANASWSAQIDSNSSSSRYYTVTCRRLFPLASDTSVDNESLVTVTVAADAEKMTVLHNLRAAAEYEISVRLHDAHESAGALLPHATLTEWTTPASFRHSDSPSYSQPDSVSGALQKVNNINLANSAASNSTALLSRCCAQPSTANGDCLRLLCDDAAMRNVTRFESVVASCTFAEVMRSFACFSAGVDRSACCRMSYLPDQCMQLCQGEDGGSSRTDSGSVDSNVQLSLCAPHLPKVRSCLFDDAYGVVPRRPQLADWYALNDSALFVSWDAKAAHDGKYVVFYKRANGSADETSVLAVDGGAEHAVVAHLHSATTYGVYVVAVNQHGASLPSTLVSVETYEANETFVHIVRSPRTTLNVYAEGSTLALRCVAPARYAASLTWYRNSKRVLNVSSRVLLTGTHNETLLFSSVLRNDMGRYVCAVKGEGDTMFLSQPTFVNVQYEPTATVFEDVVESGLFDTRELVCLFSGSPTYVRWFRTENQHEVLPTTGRYVVQTAAYPSDPMTHSTLTIFGVLFPDFGAYTCVGTNQFGAANGSIQLRPAFSPGSLAAPRHAGALDQCCTAASSSPKCAAFCSYSVQQQTNLTVRALRSCANEAGWRNMSLYWRCLAAGRDHRPCCTQMRVPDRCVQLCSGVSFPEDDSMFYCFTYRADMLRCFREGLATIPAQPHSVTLMHSFDSAARMLNVIVAWNASPQDQAATTHYRVDVLDVASNRPLAADLVTVSTAFNESALYKHSKTGLTLFNNVSNISLAHEVQLFAAQPRTFAFAVTALGPFGSSLPSEPLFVPTDPTSGISLPTSTLRSTASFRRDIVRQRTDRTEASDLLPSHNDDYEGAILATCVLLLLLAALMITVLVLLYRGGLNSLHESMRRLRSAMARIRQRIRDHLPAVDCSVTARFSNEAADSIVGSTVDIPLDCSNVDSLMNNDALS